MTPDELADELICQARQRLEEALAPFMARLEQDIRAQCLVLHGLDVPRLNGSAHATVEDMRVGV